MYKRICILLVLVLTATMALWSQSPSPVRWRASVHPGSGDTGTVTFRALISDGWHLYGTHLPAGGPRPTVFDFAGSTGVEITGPAVPSRAPKSEEDDMFGLTLSFWDSNVVFTIPYRLTGGGDGNLKVTIKYMCCNGDACRPPATERISLTIPRQ